MVSVAGSLVSIEESHGLSFLHFWFFFGVDKFLFLLIFGSEVSQLDPLISFFFSFFPPFFLIFSLGKIWVGIVERSLSGVCG